MVYDVKAYQKAWREANKEKIREYNREYRKKNLERLTENGKAYYLSNRDKIVAKKAEYNAINRDYINERQRLYNLTHYAQNAAAHQKKDKAAHAARLREWRRQNPDRQRAIQATRAARKKSSPGRYTAADILLIRRAQRNKCAYCRAHLAKKYHVDHIVPLALGGSNWPRNLQLTCAPCNQTKNARPPEVYARRIGLLI